MRARALSLLVFGMLASACTNFEDPTTVIDLRMLAVKVEPSEIILSVDLSDLSMPIVDPASNPGVKVTPLIADPAGGGRDVTFTINACPNNPFAPAPPGGGQMGGGFPSGGARTTVGSALCDENSDTTWPLAPDPIPNGMSVDVFPSAEQLKTAFMKDVFPDQFGNLHGGFDLGMPLTLDIKVQAGGEQIRGVKRVLYWAQRIDDAQAPNQIPLIDTLTTYPSRDDATFDPVGTQTLLSDVTPWEVPEGTTSIWIEPSRGLAESFETTVIDPDTHRAVPFTVERETLRYRFFATAGSFAPGITSSEPDPGFVAKGPIHIESKYNLPGKDKLPPEADGRATVTIWVVVRDDRGGESWAKALLRVIPL